MRLRIWFRNALERLKPARRLVIIDGDSLPARLPSRDLVLARDDGEDWCIGFKCPCGCSRTIELLLINEARPRWTVKSNAEQKLTLQPSIWLQTGCRSHFLLIEGRVIWC